MKHVASVDTGILYVDSSALVKLIRVEPETSALVDAIDHHTLVSSSIILTEVPRAVRRAANAEPGLSLSALVRRAGKLIDALALVTLDDRLLAVAGAIEDPELRSLDAIHVAAAAVVSPVDAFVTYDVRQAAAARRVGLSVASPGI